LNEESAANDELGISGKIWLSSKRKDELKATIGDALTLFDSGVFGGFFGVVGVANSGSISNSVF
jgi:hypothetical protein